MTDTLHIFIGVDHRQPVSLSVLFHSLIAKSSRPLAIRPLTLPTLPITRAGLTPFTFSRFLVPYLMGYGGKALFMDADICVKDDIAKLFEECQGDYALWCAKSHTGKFEFERPAVMMFNCGHPENAKLTPEYIESAKKMHYFDWLGGSDSPLIGDMDPMWNFLEHYQEPPLPASKVRAVHYTQGVPFWPETKKGPYSELWWQYQRVATSALPWSTLMGTSVHAEPVLTRLKEDSNEDNK